ncbi:hypothetical protein B6S44_06600 [Bosea sp. Tri-44]|nr:hypothetical protein B6S44_06600 [Bosea sp. Tri-44]
MGNSGQFAATPMRPREGLDGDRAAGLGRIDDTSVTLSSLPRPGCAVKVVSYDPCEDGWREASAEGGMKFVQTSRLFLAGLFD